MALHAVNATGAGTHDDPVAQSRMALAADTGRRVGAAERDLLVDGDIVADLGAFADHAEPMIEEKALPDLRTRMNVDAGEEAREMIDQPRQEEQLTFPQPVRHPVKT